MSTTCVRGIDYVCVYLAEWISLSFAMHRSGVRTFVYASYIIKKIIITKVLQLK